MSVFEPGLLLLRSAQRRTRGASRTAVPFTQFPLKWILSPPAVLDNVSLLKLSISAIIDETPRTVAGIGEGPGLHDHH